MKRWPTAPLGDFVAAKSSSVDPSKFPNEVFDLYSIPAFDSGQPEVRPGSEIGSAKQLVQPKDILLSRIVPHIRRAWVVGKDRGRRQIASGEWIVFRSAQIHPHYLRLFLIGDPFHARFMRTVSGVGGSLLRAKAPEVVKIDIPVPPFAEQERIVKLLDEVDELRRLRAQADARTASLLPALFNEMFGSPATNPFAWPLKRVGDLFDQTRGGAKCGPFGSALKKHEYTETGIPVWGIPNVLPDQFVEERSLFISPAKFGELRAYSIESGDLLLSRAGTVGRICVARPSVRDSIMGTNLIRLALDQQQVVPAFFSALMTHFGKDIGRLRANSDEGAYSFMNTTVLKTLRIYLPPLPLQREFARRAAEIHEQETKQGTSGKQLDALFQSLLHHAFRGEL